MQEAQGQGSEPDSAKCPTKADTAPHSTRQTHIPAQQRHLQLTSLYSEYRKTMVWMVLPRPISSARMVSVLWAQENRSQLRPSSWYMCRVPPVAVMKRGWLSYFTVGCNDRKAPGRELKPKSPGVHGPRCSGEAGSLPAPFVISRACSVRASQALFPATLKLFPGTQSPRPPLQYPVLLPRLPATLLGRTSLVGEFGGSSAVSSFFFFLYFLGWAGSSPIISSLARKRGDFLHALPKNLRGC